MLLAVPNMLLPTILRVLVWFEGATQKTGIELSLMRRYFLFQVVVSAVLVVLNDEAVDRMSSEQNSFLVVTLSSGVVASWSELLHQPASIPASLAQNIPRASNFFLTYGFVSMFVQFVADVFPGTSFFKGCQGLRPASCNSCPSSCTTRSCSYSDLPPALYTASSTLCALWHGARSTPRSLCLWSSVRLVGIG